MCVKIIPVYQSFKLLKSNCFAVEILFNEDKMASFFSIAKSGFNDNNEWLSMDKVGHATTAYNISVAQNDMLRWAGVKSGRAAFIGSFSALAFMTMIEIMDGHSVKWGFSKDDILANIVGCLFFDGQQLLWGQQRISLKYSYHASIFPHYNPGELGRNLQQKMLKDYNGQIYWLSLNIASFLPQTSQFPKWLNLSTGYGAEGMVGAVNNPKEIKGKLFLHLIDTASSILLLMLTSIALKVLLHLQVRFLNLIVL